MVEVESKLKKYLRPELESKDLGELKYLLRVEVTGSKRKIIICHQKYPLDLLEEIECKEKSQ